MLVKSFGSVVAESGLDPLLLKKKMGIHNADFNRIIDAGDRYILGENGQLFSRRKPRLKSPLDAFEMFRPKEAPMSEGFTVTEYAKIHNLRMIDLAELAGVAKSQMNNMRINKYLIVNDRYFYSTRKFFAPNDLLKDLARCFLSPRHSVGKSTL